MYPILFSVGPLHIYSLSLFLILAWMVFSFIFWKLLRDMAVPEERIFDLTFYATLAGLVGARVLYILLNPAVFSGNILKMLALWVIPGLSGWGGIVFAMMTLVFVSRRSGVRLGYVLDAVALALPAGLIVASLGSTLDGAEVGIPTKLPWAVRYVGWPELRHPLGLYEIIALSLIMVIVSLASRRAKKKDWPYGLVGIWFFIMLSVSMFIVEFFKVSQVYFRALSVNQWILIGIFGQAIGALYVRGGGREKLRPLVRQSAVSLAASTRRVYERIFKRSA